VSTFGFLIGYVAFREAVFVKFEAVDSCAQPEQGICRFAGIWLTARTRRLDSTSTCRPLNEAGCFCLEELQSIAFKDPAISVLA
jgi:hypothetical protein